MRCPIGVGHDGYERLPVIKPAMTRLRIIPHENPVQVAVIAAGEEVAVEVNFHMVDGHNGVTGVGAEVADEDEALELRKETLEVDAVYVAALQ